ncbi:MAG TPA: ferritin-like domain-containing protein [Patescibacteria group bacterium]|nr:ferritin-like domain-containing protein [Patescibacteria group bacterium]
MFNNIHGNNSYYGDYDRKLLDLLKEAMTDEKKDHKKYSKMMEMTDNKEILDQIHHAYEDEAKHYEMFQEIYGELTGRDIQILCPEQDQQNRLIDAVKTSINGELVAVEFYREIRAMLRGKKYRNMLFEIITDEQEHATRFVYLYSMLK